MIIIMKINMKHSKCEEFNGFSCFPNRISIPLIHLNLLMNNT